jgi:hypothetical protein
MHHFDREGQPIPWEESVRLSADREYRRVAWTALPNLGPEAFVSTVWLGLDHGWGAGPPIIFESLDFPAQKHMRRYSTLEEARVGHEELVRELGGEQ